MGSLSGSPTASTRPSGIPGSTPQPTPPAASPRVAPRADGRLDGPPVGDRPWTIRLFVLAFIGRLRRALLRRGAASPETIRSRRPAAARSPPPAGVAPQGREPAQGISAARASVPSNVTVESMRLTPSRIDITVAQPDGAQYELAVDPAFHVDKDDYPASEPEGISFSRIPADVPQRLSGRSSASSTSSPRTSTTAPETPARTSRASVTTRGARTTPSRRSTTMRRLS